MFFLLIHLARTLVAFCLKKTPIKIDIVGKLSLNEWKGKKNVEFIIDDISVNKNH